MEATNPIITIKCLSNLNPKVRINQIQQVKINVIVSDRILKKLLGNITLGKGGKIVSKHRNDYVFNNKKSK